MKIWILAIEHPAADFCTLVLAPDVETAQGKALAQYGTASRLTVLSAAVLDNLRVAGGGHLLPLILDDEVFGKPEDAE